MLQYALLHLFGYALTIDDLKNFRVSITLEQWPPLCVAWCHVKCSSPLC
jgi:hypothetical protein